VPPSRVVPLYEKFINFFVPCCLLMAVRNKLRAILFVLLLVFSGMFSLIDRVKKEEEAMLGGCVMFLHVSCVCEISCVISAYSFDLCFVQSSVHMLALLVMLRM
jgi:prolipoprotein diacylglyceryltransferase